MSNPTRVLQILHNLKNGGVQRDVLVPAQVIDSDLVKFDILLLSDVVGELETEMHRYSHIYRIPLKRSKSIIIRAIRVWTDPIYVYLKTRELVRKNGGYDAVHVRHKMFIAPCVTAAKKEGVKVRIGHSHINGPDSRELPHVKAYMELSKYIARINSTMLLGVTRDACTYLFGHNAKSYVIKNPLIDLDKFNPQKYSYPVHSEIHLIQVGSYGERKNQLFTVEILKELRKRSIDFKMVFIGYEQEGTGAEQKIIDRLREYELDDAVIMMPSNSNVADQLAQSDIMLLPSLQEGLPNTALEAQAMGVKCFLSTNVSKDADYGLCEFISLEQGAIPWAQRIIEYAEQSKLCKCFIDLSCYDNKKVCAQYVKIWQGNSFENSLSVYDVN